MHYLTFKALRKHLKSVGISLKFVGHNRIVLGIKGEEEEYELWRAGDTVAIVTKTDKALVLVARPGEVLDAEGTYHY